MKYRPPIRAEPWKGIGIKDLVRYNQRKLEEERRRRMGFFTSAVGILKTMVIAIGAGLGVWGGINLAEGYGNDNRATRS